MSLLERLPNHSNYKQIQVAPLFGCRPLQPVFVSRRMDVLMASLTQTNPLLSSSANMISMALTGMALLWLEISSRTFCKLEILRSAT